MFHQARKVLTGVAALGALALGGSAIANAATSSSTSTATQTKPRSGMPAHGTTVARGR